MKIEQIIAAVGLQALTRPSAQKMLQRRRDGSELEAADELRKKMAAGIHALEALENGTNLELDDGDLLHP